MPKIIRTLYATKAATESGQFATEFVVSMTKYGKGLFAARDIERGEIITQYSGQLLHDADLGERPRTHMLRVPGTDYIWDGYAVSRSLHYDRRTRKFIPDDATVGFGAIANSSRRGNATIKWYYNDIDGRPPTYDPRSQTNFPARHLRPKVPFLVASKTILSGQEIVWKYQVELDPDETEVDTEVDTEV